MNLKGIPKDEMTGTITIERIDVPIIKDLIVAHAKGLDPKTYANHYFFCAVGYGEHIFATKCLSLTASFKSGFLAFKSLHDITISDVKSNFDIRIEIYGLTLDPPVEKKEKLMDKLTPRKSKKGHHSGSVQPSAVPHVIRTSKFESKGSIFITAQNLKKKSHMMQNFKYESTLNGTAEIKVSLKPQYTLSYCNFLNFYDNGCWNRRWVRVQDYRLIFWRCPKDEENREEPLGQFDMRKCINPIVMPVPSEVCPRINSFALIFANCSDTNTARVNQILNKHYKSEIRR